MATQATLRQRVLDKLYSNSHQSRPALQRLDGAVADGTTESITVDDGDPISPGDVIEFEDGEQAHVVSVATNTLTVYRGVNDTTAASKGDNELVKINPVYTLKQVDDALNYVMRDLQAQGIYIMRAGTDITLVAGQYEYELTETDFDPQHGVLSVFYQEDVSLDTVGLPFKNIFDPTSSLHTTSGLGIRLATWGDNAAGDTLEVIYAAPVDALADTDDEPLLEDLLVMGATGRLLVSKEGPRLHDPGRYTDRTVQPGQHVRDGSFFLGQYQRMAWRYKAHLRAREKTLPGARYRKARKFRR